MSAVYIACSLRQRERAKDFRASLLLDGHAVTASWISRDEGGKREAELSHEVCRAIAHENHDDMDRADTLVALLSEGVRGLLVEVGYAVGAGKRVLLVGAYPGASLMLDLRGVEWVSDEAEALRRLR